MPEPAQAEFTVSTQGRGLYEMTDELRRWTGEYSVGAVGLLTLFVRHTSCSLLIQENADPDVQVDLLAWQSRFVPDADTAEMSYITHRVEGPDDMPAHIKASVLPVSVQIPVNAGRLMLGTWQGIYLFEHRDAPHTRKVVAHLA